MAEIYTFNGNDAIVRTVPASNGDRSFIGEKFIFFAVMNGIIYLVRTNPSDVARFGGSLNLEADNYRNGWEYWVEPNMIETKEPSFFDRFK